MKRKDLKEKGITLVSLVVTVIILVILAGVSLNYVLGDNGLIKEAQITSNLMVNATEYENVQMQKLKNEIVNLGNSNVGNLPDYTDIYVTLYNDGTLGFNNTSELITGKTAKYDTWKLTEGQIQNGFSYTGQPWYQYASEITSVDFVNKIVPGSLKYWFSECSNITTISNISTNLDTRRVTSMNSLFDNCYSLTSIDLSKFNTKNVTDMTNMFRNTTNLKNIYVNQTKWQIENVYGYDSIFYNCGTNVFINKSDKKIFGYVATKGWGWSGTPRSRTENSARASITQSIKIDATKTYRLTSAYAYFGFSDVNVTYDSEWIAPGNVTTTGLANLCVNFKNPDNSSISDADLENILANFKIEVVE